VDHIVVPLDPAHAQVVDRLAHDVASEAGAGAAAATGTAHITVVSYSGLPPERAIAALEPIAAATAPFTVRAHGYGIFTGDDPCDMSLHVMVVRTATLDALHERVHVALARAGATFDGLTEPLVWSPHITLLDRELTPACLGRAVEQLARHPHRSWSIEVRDLLVTSRHRPAGWQPAVLRLIDGAQEDDG
jgi:2'-5' RNA ligase